MVHKKRIECVEITAKEVTLLQIQYVTPSNTGHAYPPLCPKLIEVINKTFYGAKRNEVDLLY
jgi:hypothetical protein